MIISNYAKDIDELYIRVVGKINTILILPTGIIDLMQYIH